MHWQLHEAFRQEEAQLARALIQAAIPSDRPLSQEEIDDLLGLVSQRSRR